MSEYCHMSDDQLERFAMNRVSAREMEDFEDHMLICEPCRRRFEDCETFVDDVRTAAAEWRMREAVRRRSWWSMPRLVPVFAALVLLLAAGLSLWRPGAGEAPPVAVSLIASRGTVLSGTVAAGHPMDLRPDLAGITTGAPYRLRVVDAVGKTTWEGPYNPGTGARVPAQKVGPHFVRLYSQNGTLLREYGLDVQR